MNNTLFNNAVKLLRESTDNLLFTTQVENLDITSTEWVTVMDMIIAVKNLQLGFEVQMAEKRVDEVNEKISYLTEKWDRFQDLELDCTEIIKQMGELYAEQTAAYNDLQAF